MSDLHHSNFDAIAMSYELAVSTQSAVDFMRATDSYLPAGFVVLTNEPMGATKKGIIRRGLTLLVPNDNIVEVGALGMEATSTLPYQKALGRVGLQKEQKRLMVIEEEDRFKVQGARMAGCTVVGLTVYSAHSFAEDKGIQYPNVVVTDFPDLKNQMGL